MADVFIVLHGYAHEGYSFVGIAATVDGAKEKAEADSPNPLIWGEWSLDVFDKYMEMDGKSSGKPWEGWTIIHQTLGEPSEEWD